MENIAIANELKEMASSLKKYYQEEKRHSGSGPLTNSLNHRNTKRFFKVHKGFVAALECMSPKLGSKLSKMTDAAKELSSHMDAYDSGDRGPETHIAYLYKEKLADVRSMLDALPQ